MNIRILDKSFAPFISSEEIDTLVSDVAKRINHDYAGKEITALVIMKGAFMFAADLVRRLTVPVTVEVLRASSYGTSMNTSGRITIDATLLEIQNRHVVIIEDIVDTGSTLVELIKHLSSYQPASVTVAALLSKPDMHRDGIVIDYVGREIPPKFVIGYGMDYAGQGRNLGGVYILDETT
jgi:hypoxanthine phosphoribosyltransferase